MRYYFLIFLLCTATAWAEQDYQCSKCPYPIATNEGCTVIPCPEEKKEEPIYHWSGHCDTLDGPEGPCEEKLPTKSECNMCGFPEEPYCRPIPCPEENYGPIRLNA